MPRVLSGILPGSSEPKGHLELFLLALENWGGADPSSCQLKSD